MIPSILRGLLDHASRAASVGRPGCLRGGDGAAEQLPTSAGGNMQVRWISTPSGRRGSPRRGNVVLPGRTREACMEAAVGTTWRMLAPIMPPMAGLGRITRREVSHGELAQSQDADSEPHRHDGTADSGGIQRLRRAGLSHARREALLHGSKGHIVLDRYPGEWEAMPSYIEEPEAAACKWVSIRERNREKYDLPTVFSILIYTHPETGFPLAICDGSYHTVMRTGAAGAVSAKWMARKNSKRLAIVGAGHMAEGTLATCNEVFKWEEVRVWSRTQATLDHFMQTQQPKFPQLKIRPSTDLEQVVRRRRRGDGDPGARADRDG